MSLLYIYLIFLSLLDEYSCVVNKKSVRGITFEARKLIRRGLNFTAKPDTYFFHQREGGLATGKYKNIGILERNYFIFLFNQDPGILNFFNIGIKVNLNFTFRNQYIYMLFISGFDSEKL